MRHKITCGITACALTAVFFSWTPAWATTIRRVPIYECVAQADLVAVGNVTAIENHVVEVESFPGAVKINRLAVVKLTERILGDAELTQVRVGFASKESQPQDRLPIKSPVLKKDDEVLIFVRRRPGTDFYQFAIGGPFGLIHRTEAASSFKKMIDEAKNAARLLEDPSKSLRSTNTDERILTAQMLSIRYSESSLRGIGEMKQEPIAADESQLILKNLLLLANKSRHEFLIAISRFGPTTEDGFEGPIWGEGGEERTLAWVKGHAATFRIKKWVPEKP